MTGQDFKITRHIGFYSDSRQALIEYLGDADLSKTPLMVVLPCGVRTYSTYDAIPATSDPCGCDGSWFIKYRDEAAAEIATG